MRPHCSTDKQAQRRVRPLTLTLDHDETHDAADKPVLELINGHNGHTTAVGSLLTRAIDVNDLSVPVSAGVALAVGNYTAQIANYHWQWGGAFSYSLTINVNEAATGDTALVLSGTTQNSYREDFTSSVATYDVITSEDGAVRWSLSGPDSGDFSISNSGTLTFAAQPDYEAAVDSNSDNVYELTVTATRGNATGSLSVSITVTDLNESYSDDSVTGGF